MRVVNENHYKKNTLKSNIYYNVSLVRKLKKKCLNEMEYGGMHIILVYYQSRYYLLL